jgi:hypothetical protein
MPLTRRQVIAGTAAAALAGGGVYELVDRLTGGSGRPAAATAARREQHLLDGLRVVRSNDVEVIVPPLHMQVVTLELTAGESRADLRAARAALEDAIAAVERRYAPTPAGVGVTLAWGLPYFDRFVPDLARTHLPVDRRASKAAGGKVGALLDAIRFPSDPGATILERNDAALLLRSDSLDRIADASHTLVKGLDLWRPTSIRRGFAGGGFDGATALPRRMALAAGVPGAQLIPEQAELFLGFTSTQKAGLGPGRIANLETLGYSDGGPAGYFTGGTTMHLSHIFEDLEAWYLGLDFNQRVATLFQPDKKTPPGTLTVRQGPDDVATIAENRRDYRRFRGIGHSAVPQRADANTLDNPFFWSARPEIDGMASGAAAGVHFVVFHPTSDDFARTRRAMDGVFTDGTRIPLERGDPGQGINSVLTTTHRQNFLVPPRPHRALPLVDLIT